MILYNYSNVPVTIPTEVDHYNFIMDVFEAGIISYEKTVYEFNVNRNFNYFNQCLRDLKMQKQSYIGLCMESFVARYLTVNESVRLEMLRKCCYRNITEKYNEHIFPLGFGLNSTSIFRNQSFNKQSPQNDIVFVKKNGKDGSILTDNKSKFDNVGFQVKAIKTNIVDTIITPINQRKYSQVLTLLEVEENGIITHTKEICLAYIHSNKDKYNKYERKNLENSIISPSDIGIPQQVINNYYDYMWHAFDNEFNYSPYIYNGLWQYYNWLCTIGEIMNKSKIINQLPIDENFNENIIELAV